MCARACASCAIAAARSSVEEYIHAQLQRAFKREARLRAELEAALAKRHTRGVVADGGAGRAAEMDVAPSAPTDPAAAELAAVQSRLEAARQHEREMEEVLRSERAEHARLMAQTRYVCPFTMLL